MNQTACPHCGKAITLLKATAEPEEQAKPTSANEQAPRLVSCKRCGETGLTWVKSFKTGKPYLCQADLKDGEVVPHRKQFHKCPGPDAPVDQERNYGPVTEEEIPF